jgi:hypothetical protein
VINYEITKASPKQLFMQVRYYSEGHPDYWKSFVIEDFSDANVQSVAKSGASYAQSFWEATSDQPESVVVTTTGSAKNVINLDPPSYNQNSQTIKPLVTETETTITNGWVIKDIVNLDAPKIDMFNQNITRIQTETETQVINEWVVSSKTEQEIVSFLTEWRSFAFVTPRQARLELAKRGLLANIDEIISLIPEPDKTTVKIEWEYAVSVERSSPWVIQLGSALGLDEEGLDELFKAAAEL